MKFPSPFGGRALRLLALGVLIAGGVALSAARAAEQRPGTDFHAKWTFGKQFYAGEPVYVLRPDVRGPPTYPPFAVQVFQLLALFPLKVAAGLFYFLNLVLSVAAVLLTRRVVWRLWPGSRDRRWPLVAAVICTAQFYLINLNLIQIDAFLYAVVLGGIALYLTGRDIAAAAALVGATAMKLVPIFFPLWLLLRGRRRAGLAAVALGGACVALPFAQRGIRQGWEDLSDYYALVLRDVRRGDVNPSYLNQSLGAAIHRATRPPRTDGVPDYRLVSASETTARALSRGAALAVAFALLGNLLWLRARGEALSAFEVAAVFLTGHLVSAISWKAHLVTLLFAAYAWFAIPARALPVSGRAAWAAVAILLAGVGLSGRDLVGNALHHWIGGYSVVTWLMLVLWGGSLLFSHHRARVWERAVAVPATA